MKRALPLIWMAVVGLVSGAYAEHEKQALKGFAEGTPVVIVGEITSQPRDAGVAVESKMQVGVGPQKTDYTLHLKDARMFGFHGGEVAKSGLKDKTWVRAEGTLMDDPRRIKVSRLQVIGGNAQGMKATAFYRPGYDHGYVMAVAGTREVFPAVQSATFMAAPFTIVGKVSDDTGALERTRKIQVQAAGNEWTVRVPDDAMVVDAKGEKISVHEIKEGQWIRATGWQTDDLRMRVMRVENIGPETAFRASQAFRRDFPLGYVDRLPADRSRFGETPVSGTVTSINREWGYFTVKGTDGRDQRVYFDVAEWPGGVKTIDTLRVGDQITVRQRFISY